MGEAGHEAIIVGGGVMGCAVALRLAEAGLSCLVLERSVPGAEASSVAAGILGPAVEAKVHGPALALGLASRERHESLADQLRSDHGIDVGFRRCGVLRVALTEPDLEAIDAHAALLREAGVPHARLTAGEVHRLEPAVHPEALGGLDMPDEAQLDPRLLLPALAIAAERAGARFRSGATVRQVWVEGGRVRGVEVDAERIEAPTVVVAAGSWTSLVPGLGLSADAIFPVRGQILACRTRPPLFRRVVFGPGGYIVTRPDGRTLCGSTEERVGFRREVTLGGLERIIGTARRIAPALADAPIEGYWSSFRPGTPDDLPLVGRAGPEGLFLASGHYRNGILLSAITADHVVGAVLGNAPEDGAHALDPLRFSAEGREAAREGRS